MYGGGVRRVGHPVHSVKWCVHVIVNPEFGQLEVCAAVCAQGNNAGWWSPNAVLSGVCIASLVQNSGSWKCVLLCEYSGAMWFVHSFASPELR